MLSDKGDEPIRLTSILISLSLLIGCGSPQRPHQPQTGNGDASADQVAAAPGWSLQAGANATTLVLADRDGAAAIRLTCAAGEDQLSVNVPGFRPVGSEERLSFGGGGDAMALVADPAGDKVLGGVTGAGPIPDELKRLLIGPMSASYGAQTSGPHPPPPDRLAAPFLGACGDALTAARTAQSKPAASTSPCLVQDGELLRIPKQKALGTEPFWAATIEGRCVTYSTPENQQGTRIWTRVGTGPMGPIWSGSYEGKPFVLRIQPAVRCSDGMSDRVYDLEAALIVAGEERKGCAMRS